MAYASLLLGVMQIVTGSFDKTAKLWDSETGQLLHTLRGHTTVSAIVSLPAPSTEGWERRVSAGKEPFPRLE